MNRQFKTICHVSAMRCRNNAAVPAKVRNTKPGPLDWKGWLNSR